MRAFRLLALVALACSACTLVACDDSADGFVSDGAVGPVASDGGVPSEDAATPWDASAGDGGGGACGATTGSSSIPCDDGVVCTVDVCRADGTCAHNPHRAACPSGFSCDASQGCVLGAACGSDADCVDSDPCTTHETCNVSTATCFHDVLDHDDDGESPPVCGGSDCDDARDDVSSRAPEICGDAVDNDCDGVTDLDATLADNPALRHDEESCGTCGTVCGPFTTSLCKNGVCGACGGSVGADCCGLSCDDTGCDVSFGFCGDGLDCDVGTAKCVAVGGLDQRCADGAMCGAGLVCDTSTTPTGVCRPCGAAGQRCCPASQAVRCGAGTLCVAGTCETCGSPAAPLLRCQQDADGDGFGDPATETVLCECPAGRIVANPAGDDCDDAAGSVHPDQPELCNGIDDDCDRQIDESGTPITCFRDVDGDGYHDADTGISASCACPAGFIPANPAGSDCADAVATAYPGSPQAATPVPYCLGGAGGHATTLAMADASSLTGYACPGGYVQRWDYDCDGTDVRRWNVVGLGDGCSASSCSSSFCISLCSDGWSGPSAPDCGQEGAFRDGTPGASISFCSSCVARTERQACR